MANPTETARAVERSVHLDPPRKSWARAWIDAPALDWIGALSAGLLFWWAGDRIPLDQVEPGTRFAFYAGLAAAVLSFVAIAFTPLAILVAFDQSREAVRRLRRHDDALQSQYLRSTLYLLVGAVAFLVVGVFEAAVPDGHLVARTTAAAILGLAAAKVGRLTRLFWAILTAGRIAYPSVVGSIPTGPTGEAMRPRC